MSNTRHLVTGCSGGGKSTLVSELARQGFATVQEPGRRIIRASGRDPHDPVLPWNDGAAFARAAIEMAQSDLAGVADREGPVFFDRGLVDAVLGLAHETGDPPSISLSGVYATQVFVAPPWPEIYETDAERRHGLSAARAEFDRLMSALPDYGYETVLLPKVAVPERAAFVLRTIGIG